MLTAGIHLLHKPVGPTSFSLVQAAIAEARAGQTRRPRICHGGTLDPFACGLLLILAGPATKLFDYLHAIPKVYDATVRWGIETDNGDLLGRATFTGDSSGLSPRQLDDLLTTFIGWHDQIPHATSARRIDGERAYLKAHRGETVIMPPTRVYLHEARWLSHDLPRESQLRLTVRGGYYVRAMARDLGGLAGCGAHLTALHRTSIGPWADPGPGRSVEIHGRDLLPWSSARDLSNEEAGELRQGKAIAIGNLLPADWQLPEGFPDPEPPVRGFHLGKLTFLLRRQEATLQVISALGSGL